MIKGVTMSVLTSIEEYEEEARKKTPPTYWDYVSAGSTIRQRTAIRNVTAYDRLGPSTCILSAASRAHNQGSRKYHFIFFHIVNRGYSVIVRP